MQLGVAASRAEICKGTEPKGQCQQGISAARMLLAQAAVLHVQPDSKQAGASKKQCSARAACGLTLGLGLADRCVMSPGICSSRSGSAAEWVFVQAVACRAGTSKTPIWLMAVATTKRWLSDRNVMAVMGAGACSRQVPF